MKPLGNHWDELLKSEFEQPYYLELRRFLKEEYRNRVIYPDMFQIFNAFTLTDYPDVRVVILGQDPYHEPNQAHGLAFSVQEGNPFPPSLLNIWKELKAELGCEIPPSGDLTGWAKQGVLLLNTCLTVRQHQANSHQRHGWEQFTDAVIRKLNERKEPIVFLLWGANARSKKEWITNPAHLVLESAHPSPLSAHRGFFGCGHFVKTNEFLEQQGYPPINWQTANGKEFV